MLAAKGYKIEAVDADGTLVCSADSCVCLVDLDCAGTGCITLDENLDAFRDALGGKGGAQVSCELADTGRLCDGSYFRFEGDIYRYEDRYFGADGHLIGMKTSTDYTEYCHGRAMYQFAGTIPDCAKPATDVKVLCSENGRNRPIGNPMELLLWAIARQ